MIKQVEADRFQHRYVKCSQCIYNQDLTCSDKPCFPQDRADNLNVYFVEDDE